VSLKFLLESIRPPTFSTPPKLLPVEYVTNNNPGSDLASLRLLTTALARDAIFGREQELEWEEEHRSAGSREIRLH